MYKKVFIQSGRVVFIMLLILLPALTSFNYAQVIDGGYGHTIILCTSGDVWGVGYNASGQLGDGTNKSRLLPTKIPGMSEVKDIACGAAFTLFLKKDGTVWSTGENTLGELGLGEGTNSSIVTPTQIPGLANIRDIAAGDNHGMALLANGRIMAWGWNENGQIGDGTEITRWSPVDVLLVDSVIQIEAGSWFSLALRGNGKVMSWGRNNFGQLGDGTNQDGLEPDFVAPLNGILTLSAGNAHVLAVDAKGDVYGWGRNWYGNLGLGTTQTQEWVPIKLPDIGNIKMVHAASNSSYAVVKNGTIYTWGENYEGQLGLGHNNDVAVPQIMKTIQFGATVGGGDVHAWFVDNEDKYWSCGNNLYGQCGDSTTTNSNVPQLTSMNCTTNTAAFDYKTKIFDEFMVAPNPFSQNTFIYFDNDGENLSQIQIFDLMGKQVFSVNQIVKSPYCLDKGLLSPGIYILNVSNTEKEIGFCKILVK